MRARTGARISSSHRRASGSSSRRNSRSESHIAFLLEALIEIVFEFVPRRLVPISPVPGLSLVLAPLVAGAAMEGIGRLWLRLGWDRSAIFTFRGGAIVAFVIGLVRFSYLQLGWLHV